MSVFCQGAAGEHFHFTLHLLHAPKLLAFAFSEEETNRLVLFNMSLECMVLVFYSTYMCSFNSGSWIFGLC